MTKTNYDGKMNIYPKETPSYITKEDQERHALQTHNEKAEIWNSYAAMLGFVAGVISYALTGKLFFGLY
jgi:hypothetical protein